MVFQGQLPDLGVQRLDVDLGRRGFSARAGAEHIDSTFLELLLPRCDLADVNIELISLLRNRPLALDGSQGHFRHEGR